MCNHYRIANPELALALAETIAEQKEQPDWEITAEAWPEAAMPVIYQSDRRTLATMRWGVRPHYDPAGRPVVNARDDGLTTKAMWKTSTAKRRCLVPADGFWEWTGSPGEKWEVLFHRPNSQPFFFAGIWSPDSTGAARGFALVTGSPHPAVAALPHDRTPVILSEGDALAWIGKEPIAADELLRLCRPYAGELIRRNMPLPPSRKKVKSESAPAPTTEQGELF